MGVSKEWIKNNIIDSFSVVRDGFQFDFSVHPLDPKLDMSHIHVDIRYRQIHL